MLRERASVLRYTYSLVAQYFLLTSHYLEGIAKLRKGIISYVISVRTCVYLSVSPLETNRFQLDRSHKIVYMSIF